MANGIGRAFRHRNYRLFCSGQLVSLIGTWMQSTAQAWLIYRLTGSSVLLGLVGFSSQIPVFIIAPVGGMLADRVRRHRVLVVTQTSAMLLAFALATLTLTGVVRVWHVFVLAPLLGVVNAFDIPARQSFISEMVSADDLLNAIALNSSMVNGARIVGPALAGVTLAAVGEGWCFFAIGPTGAVAIGGVCCVLAAGVFALRLPRFRDEARRIIIAMPALGGEPPEEGTGAQAGLTTFTKSSRLVDPSVARSST